MERSEKSGVRMYSAGERKSKEEGREKSRGKGGTCRRKAMDKATGGAKKPARAEETGEAAWRA